MRIAVKVSRAVDVDSCAALYVQALADDSKKRAKSDVQQVKPDGRELFVWVGEWRDVIRYEMLLSDERAKNQYNSPDQQP